MEEKPGKYEPQMSDEQVERIRDWHEAAYRADARTDDITIIYLDREFVIPPEVHPIQGMAESFGKPILDEVRPTDRVLDMGTGSGVNAVLAASRSRDVVAVDVNPVAVATARKNAERNGVADRIDVRESDVFRNVTGKFDLIIFDPPFRWFKPRDLRERGTADEGYETLRTFFRGARNDLAAGGRILLCFGTSGDIDYLKQLIRATGFKSEVMVKRDLEKDGQTVSYFTYRLT
jgi:release factor glutamine methyltransferase